jgi:ABC-type nitrate/sulfonate/bicarbonate transport system ATPase subunit
MSRRGTPRAACSRRSAGAWTTRWSSWASAHSRAPIRISFPAAWRSARALARALANDPALLWLDEPLGKLDSLTRLTLQAELVALWRSKGFTAILVTHDVEEALLLASRVIVLSERPARIKAEFAVEFDYPRHRDDPRLVALRRQILGTLGHPT